MQVILKLDEEATLQLEVLRKKYYPKHLNQHKAHLTLFYKLYLKHTAPLEHAIKALSIKPFEILIDHIHIMPAGMQLQVTEKQQLVKIKRGLISKLNPWIFKHDRNKYYPHVTIQHGVTAFKAQQTAAQLKSDFKPIKATVIGLECQEIIYNKVKSSRTIIL